MAAGQQGYVAARQAGTDAEARAWLRRATKLDYDRSFRGVYGQPWTHAPSRRLAQALLWVGPPAVLTGLSALWAHGLVGTLPTLVDVVTAHDRRSRCHRGVKVRRTRHFDGVGASVIGQIPVASVAWAISDIAAGSTPGFLRALIVDARQRRLMTTAELTELLDRRGSVAGANRLRRLVWQLDAEQPDSVLEHEIRRRIRRDELPAPSRAPVGVSCPDGRIVHLDVGWPVARVGLDCHGFGSHSERAHLDVDAIRSNGLAGTDWRVFIATWRHVDDDVAWGLLARQLRSALLAVPKH